MIDRVVGKYKILAQIGEGGMGVVYRAQHVVLGSPAAIKILLPQFTRDPVVVERLFTEAKASSAIRHPGIVEVFDYGHTGDITYIAMELLRGESLQNFLTRNHKLSASLAAQIAAQMFAALDAVHVRGVVHRDLKPDNVFLVRDRTAPGSIRIKLLDFGIAKLVGEPSTPRIKTKGGVILGTPAYMAPEQCRGGSGEIDARADLYAVGCILFQMLTGRPPFDAEGSGEVMAMHIYEPPPRLHSLQPKLPVELDALLAKLLVKRAEDRIPSAAFALAALERAPIEPLFIEIPLVDGISAVQLPELPEREGLPWWIPVLVLVLALAIAGAAVYFIGMRGDVIPKRRSSLAAAPTCTVG
ncbi:MAG: serine/threonine protein kinase [Deltaproteobacteria bacterium]|nr:serine/threonine protein kinase [Deltaproteobacteria bacterium]